MNSRPRLLLLSVFLLGLVSCSTVNQVKIPVALDKSPQRFRIKLETKAQILAVQVLQKNTACDRVKNRLKATITGGSGKKFTTETTCGLVRGALVVQTKDFLPKGEYEVSVETSLSEDLAELPLVTVKCFDADANSGPEQDYEGAQELAENQSLKGTLNYAGAVTTRWVQMKAKGGELSLFFIPESADEVRATLFMLPKGAKAPKKLGPLPAKVKRRIKPDGTLYVQIAAERYTGEVGFHLSRKDVAATKSVNVGVIDCFAVNSRSSVVILKPNDSLKVNDELQIRAKKTNGQSVELGKCVVNSVGQGQVSCRMEAVSTEELTQYSAVLEKEGSNT